MPRTKEPAMPRNHGAGIALIQEPASPRSQPVIAALSALPMQKTESRRNLHFSLRLSAIPCLLSYMCFRLKETAVAVRPSADASASMIQSPD